MLRKIAAFMRELVADERPRPNLDQEEQRLAAAALLVRATLVDGIVATEERKTLTMLLEKRFELSRRDAGALIEAAQEREHDAVDLYGFTRVLAKQLDPEGRAGIVEMLWEIAFADGEVHEFESNLIWRVAELLHVPSRERLRLKKLVESRH